MREYAIFISKVKRCSATMELKEAVDRAVAESIQKNILKEFLEAHRREVVNMCLTEFDEVKYSEIIREEGREEGRLETLFKLVNDGMLSKEDAIKASGLSKEEFDKRTEEILLSV